MGGKGSGGIRVGAGRRPKAASERALGGWADKRTPLSERKQAKHGPVSVLPPPEDLPEAQREVWLALAPEAAKQRTLTEQTAAAFALLCKQIVLERMMFEEISKDGLTETKVTLQMNEAGGGLQSVEKKAHALLARHCALMLRVESGLFKFRLAPMGKELDVPEAPKDDWAEFDDAGNTH